MTLYEYLYTKMFGLKGKPCDSLSHYSFLYEILFVCVSALFGFGFRFFLKNLLCFEVEIARAEGRSNEWDQDGWRNPQRINKIKKIVENHLKLHRNIVEVKHI